MRIAILGRGKTRKYLKYSENVAYWALNDDALTVPQHNLAGVWEMHTDWATRYPDKPEYLDYLRRPQPFPIYTHGLVREIPSSVPYPIYSMPRRYFTCSAALALAYAITQTDYTEIELWGIDLMNEPGQNYSEQRASVYYWMGFAEGFGKQIIPPPQSKLFDAPIYHIAKAPER
jgi:hypothetical protein